MHFLAPFWTEYESQIFLCGKQTWRKPSTEERRNREKFNYWKFNIFCDFAMFISKPFKKYGNMANLQSLADKSP